MWRENKMLWKKGRKTQGCWLWANDSSMLNGKERLIYCQKSTSKKKKKSPLRQLFRFLSIKCQEIACTFVQAGENTHTYTLCQKSACIHPHVGRAPHQAAATEPWLVYPGTQRAACAYMHLLDRKWVKQLFSMICLTNRVQKKKWNDTTFWKTKQNHNNNNKSSEVWRPEAESDEDQYLNRTSTWTAESDEDQYLNEMKLADIQSWSR